VGVSGRDVVMLNPILGGNSFEAIVTDYQGRRFGEEGSNDELVVGLQGYISDCVMRHPTAGNKLRAPVITAPDTPVHHCIGEFVGFSACLSRSHIKTRLDDRFTRSPYKAS